VCDFISDTTTIICVRARGDVLFTPSKLLRSLYIQYTYIYTVENWLSSWCSLSYSSCAFYVTFFVFIFKNYARTKHTHTHKYMSRTTSYDLLICVLTILFNNTLTYTDDWKDMQKHYLLVFWPPSHRRNMFICYYTLFICCIVAKKTTPPIDTFSHLLTTIVSVQNQPNKYYCTFFRQCT